MLYTAVCGLQIVGRRVRMQSRKLPEWLVDVIHAGVAGMQRFLEDARRVGNDVAAVHGDAAFGADEAGAAFAADVLAGIAGRVDHHAVGVAVVDRAVLRPGLDGLRCGPGSPSTG